MKRILSCLLLLALLLPLAACAREEAESGKLRIVASAFPEYDFVRAVAGDRADLTLLLMPGTEAHSYEPTPQDILALHGARFIRISPATVQENHPHDVAIAKKAPNY